MQELIIHLLKSAGLVTLFFAAYFFLLKNDTDFNTNRIFLLAGVFTSLLLPFLKITRTVVVEPTAAPVFFEDLTTTSISSVSTASAGIDWWQIAGIVYLIGLSFFLLKFLFELFSLLKLLYTHKSSKKGDFYIIHRKGNMQPFSFFRFIVIDPDQHTPAEKDLILRHECSHARNWHSVDQLLASLSVYLLWFNPLAWLYRKSLVQNLEYLADKDVIAAEVSKKEYQRTLLKISVGNVPPVLTNQFYQSFIKKRIIMLNKNTSQKSPFWKVSAVLPFLLIFIFSFNVTTKAQVKEKKEHRTSEVPNELEIAVTISKNTTTEALSMYQKIFNKRGTTLQFSDMEYSDRGLLTAISISYSNKKANHTGEISLNNPAGIRTTVIFSGDKGSGFRQPRDSGQPKDVMAGSALSKLGKNPLFVINNELYPSEKLYGKHIQVDGEMSILETMEALDKYGSRGADGVVIIPNGEIISDFMEAMKKIDSDNKAVKRNYIQIEKDHYPSFISLENDHKPKQEKEKDQEGKFSNVPYHQKADDIIAVQQDNKSTTISQETEPLVVVNGKVQAKDFQVSKINTETIERINVLKGEDAVKKYGEKGKNGVIEIDLKTEEEMNVPGAQSDVKGKLGTITIGSSQFDDSSSNGKRSTSISVRDVGQAKSLPEGILYVVDGKEMTEDFDVDSISPEKIESMTVLKGDKATSKYGEKASRGVIEISLKKN